MPILNNPMKFLIVTTPDFGGEFGLDSIIDLFENSTTRYVTYVYSKGKVCYVFSIQGRFQSRDSMDNLLKYLSLNFNRKKEIVKDIHVIIDSKDVTLDVIDVRGKIKRVAVMSSDSDEVKFEPHIID